MSRRILLAAIACLCACAPASTTRPATPAAVALEAPPAAPQPSNPTVTPDEPFRKDPPRAGVNKPFVPPQAVRARLGNGISVVFVSVPSHDCAIAVLAAGGTADVAPDRPNKLDVVDEMLSTMNAGTFKHETWNMEDHLGGLAMPYPSWSYWMDGVAFSSSVPCKQFAGGAEIMADLVLDPSFEPHTFERTREQDARKLDDLPSDGARVAERVLERALFGSHVYGSISTAAHTRAVTRAEVVSLYARVFQPSRITVIVAGDLQEKDTLPVLENTFGKAPAGGGGAPVAPVPALRAGPTIVVVDRPGAATSFIAAAFAGATAAATDEVPARMATLIAMHSTVGRGTRLRDELELVPSTEAIAWTWRSAGELGWRARAPTENVAAVLVEADRIMRALATDGPTDDEMDVTRNWMTTSVVGAFETPDRIAATYVDTTDLGLPDEVILSKPARLAAISAAEVRAAAARYFDPARMSVVVVGDLAALREPLAKLGWGPVEVRDATGEIVRPAARAGSR